MFLIDFDGTLYNTYAFIQKIYAVLESHGVSRDDARTTMKTAIIVGDDLHYDYTYERQVSFLKEQGYEFDEQSLLVDLNALFEESFEDPEAAEFLARVKALNKKVVLLTAGNPQFQKQKLDSTTLGSYFDEFVAIRGDKDKYVQRLSVDREEIVFINDKIPENEAVKALCPEVHVIERFNPNKVIANRVPTMEFPKFDSLLEIADYVEQHYA